MRTSTTLKIAGGAAALAFSCLLFLNTSQAGAAGAKGSDSPPPAWAYTYRTQGWAYGTDKAPTSGADLIHVKINNGHTHTLVFKPYDLNGNLVGYDHVKVSWGDNAWYDPSKIKTVQITISDHQPITATIDGNHCYYENKHGDLQATTHGDCNPN